MPTSALTSRAAAESALSTHYNTECVVQNGEKGVRGILAAVFLMWECNEHLFACTFLPLFVDSNRSSRAQHHVSEDQISAQHGCCDFSL